MHSRARSVLVVAVVAAVVAAPAAGIASSAAAASSATPADTVDRSAPDDWSDAGDDESTDWPSFEFDDEEDEEDGDDAEDSDEDDSDEDDSDDDREDEGDDGDDADEDDDDREDDDRDDEREEDEREEDDEEAEAEDGDDDRDRDDDEREDEREEDEDGWGWWDDNDDEDEDEESWGWWSDDDHEDDDSGNGDRGAGRGNGNPGNGDRGEGDRGNGNDDRRNDDRGNDNRGNDDSTESGGSEDERSSDGSDDSQPDADRPDDDRPDTDDTSEDQSVRVDYQEDGESQESDDGERNATRNGTVEPGPNVDSANVTVLREPDVVGQPLVVTATTTNEGTEAGRKVVQFEVEHEIVDREEFVLGPNETRTVTFTHAFETPGNKTFEVDAGLNRFVTVEERRPNLSVSTVEVAPGSVEAGEDVTITAVVSNDGHANGSLPVALELFGEMVDVENVTLATGESREVTFTRTVHAPGTYEAAVGNETAEFRVTGDTENGSTAATNESVLESAAETPGFEPLAALAGVVVAVALALGRRE